MRSDRPTWDDLVWGTEDLNLIWEAFHENSKSTAVDDVLPNYAVVDWMTRMKNALAYDAFAAIPLPPIAILPPFRLGLSEAILARQTPSGMAPARMSFATLAALLFYSYGINRPNEAMPFPRPLRNVPSGGALFPLEIYFHARSVVEGLAPGLYHYNPEQHCVRQIVNRDLSEELAGCLFQPEIVRGAALLVVQTALFRRNTVKYGDRGYRFTLIEAGHVAQNLNLVATALGLGVWNVGGFQDRALDRLMGIDGINHSSLYLQAIGEKID
ncbi:nitroreductase [Bradyrhizobium sp. Leo170]|nr:nitroreductase [Bradyrhizobium sp. Leo170]